MIESTQTLFRKQFAALTTAGVFLLTGCATSSPDFDPTSSASPTRTAAPGFSLDTLGRTSEGVCANPQIAKIALENCLLLPPVTQDAHFQALTDPDDGNQYNDEANEERKIAEFHGAISDDGKLSPAHKAALKDILDDAVPAAALAAGTRIVIEQQTSRNVYPKHIAKNNTLRVHVATDGQPASLGEERAIITHESAHAVTAEWKWDTKEDAAILKAYTAELNLGVEQVRSEHAAEFVALLKVFDNKVKQEYESSVISKKARDAMLKTSDDLKELVDARSGLGAALVEDGYGEDMTQLRPFRSVLFEDLSDEDMLKMGSESPVLGLTFELDNKLAGYLAERFSYVTEYKNMEGMVVWNLGHPWDDTAEYIASLTAIVELAPDRFISSVKDIKGSRNKTVVALVLGIAKKYEKENPELYKKSNFPYVIEQLRG